MYEIAVEIVFHAGHFLKLPQGPRESLHRHAWRVRITVASEVLDAAGLVMDFHQLRNLLRQTVAPLEKPQAINDLPEFTGADKNPSTERIARYIYDRLLTQLPRSVSLTEVFVWETPTCRAGFRPG